MTETPLLVARDITKVFRRGDQDIHALRGISLTVGCGEYVSIMGPSGSGKSTLFNIIGGLDKPTEGEVRVGGCRLADLTSDQLAWFRCHKIGFVFQSFNLVMSMTALENVAIPRILAGVPREQAREDAARVLDRVGLGHRATHLPGQVSGGQQQRIAIARAIVNRPQIILADEPTGNLDLHTGEEIIALLNEMKQAYGITIITSTHDMKMISVSDTLVKIRNGMVEAAIPRSEMNVTVGSIDGKTVA